jgi:pimeloyl-ACP methyl ester carboxylesterase
MLALKRTTFQVEGFISLSGASSNVFDIINLQLSQSGISDQLVLRAREIMLSLLSNQNVKEVPATLLSIFHPKVQPDLSSWLEYTPLEEFKKVEIPTLIIHGDKDSQVPVQESKSLGMYASQYFLVENMNHLGKEIYSDEENRRSYFDLRISISPELISLCREFILEKR